MIDANKQMGEEVDGISLLAATCNLSDIHAHHHEGINNIATYARGSKRIDFILTSKTLLPKTTASGFLAFYDGIETGHRGSFVDFDADMLFQGKTPSPYTQAPQHLTSKKNKTVRQYKADLWKRILNHNIKERSDKIKAQASNTPLPANFEQELNSIANTIQTAMLQTEAACAKSPGAEYSKQLADLNSIVKYWKTVKSGIKTGKKMLDQLQSIRMKINLQSRSKLIQQYNTEKHIRMAIKEYNKAIPNAKEMRNEHLLEAATAAAKRGKKSEAQHYKSMAYAKNSRETYQILRNIVKPEDRSSIRQIDIPQRNETGKIMKTKENTDKLITILHPKEVENTIIQRNITHFGQADGTPFTTKDITNIFAKDGNTQATDNLLRG